MAQAASSPINWGLLPLLVIAFAITLSLQLDDDREDIDQAVPPDRSDYFIRGAKMSALGPHGKLVYQIQAREILHFPDRSATLKDMTVHYQGGPAGIWQLKSKQGVIPAGGEKLTLQGDVFIKGNRPNKGLTQMKMNEVDILPGSGMMVTTAPVSIMQPGSRMTAVGMQADILKDVINLSSDVQVRYAW